MPVPNPAIETFTSSSLTIRNGEAATLSWITSDASSVSISGIDTALAPEGSVAVTPDTTTTYILTASNAEEASVSERVTVAVTYRDRVTIPPASLGLDPFYGKLLDADGLLIVTSDKVPDTALFRARDITDEMLINRPDLRATMSGLGVRVVVIAESEVTTDIPEWSDLNEVFPIWDWDTRARGLGATRERPATGAGVENVLCYEDDAYKNEDIFVHEFAHTVLDMGVKYQAGGGEFRKRLETAYRDALDAGLWEYTYAGENPDEYWAEGVQSWFDLNDPPGFIHNHVNTRVELEEYDPTLAGLIHEVFGDTEITASCHEVMDGGPTSVIQGVVLGPDGMPLEGIGLWAWQGQREDSGFGQTYSNGVFTIRVPDGTFTLDVYAGEGCSFVGWYDGEGISSSRSQAQRLTVSGDDLVGIAIMLPGQPEDLPRIEQCS